MKRVGFIWEKIISIENIKLAHKHARKDKSFYREVKMVDANLDYYAKEIQKMLINKSYKVSNYRIQVIDDKGKERKLMKLQYYPDRIIQWAVMLQLEPVFMKSFCYHTCASLPGRGIDRAWKLTRKYLRDKKGCKYCLKIDVRKFYDNINHEILKKKLRKKIKDVNVLWLLDSIIDSYPDSTGVPIGSYLSQYFANFYLSDFDHYLKEDLQIKYLVRYMDDCVIFGNTKSILHEVLKLIKAYLQNELLELKKNYQIFSTGVRGVDFVGYRFFGNYILLRKKSVKAMRRLCYKILSKMRKNKMINFTDFCGINSYAGMFQYCDGYRLFSKYMEPIRPAIFKYYKDRILKSKSKSRYREYINNFNSKKTARVA